MAGHTRGECLFPAFDARRARSLGRSPQGMGLQLLAQRQHPPGYGGSGYPVPGPRFVFAKSTAASSAGEGRFPPWLRFYDVFHPAWPDACDAHAKEMLESIAGDPYFVGYWIDNEPLLEG
ncbi:MAG: hypothetical protein U9Q79_00900 [Candidatus Hydrogenedentes bacterium]|nr:hypothetical protein [Candidatus Hydrogenedentota bacterium]